jgi:CRP/FNR family transcriptional regulator, cyclic AMP receptor protein
MSDVTSSALAVCPFLQGMSEDHLAMLSLAAKEVGFPAGHRLFEDGNNAKKFWLIESGRVALDLQVPGEGRVVVNSLAMGDLLGWSWLFPPYQWAFGAVAVVEVRAFEFDAETVRARCAADPEFGHDLTHRVAVVLARRLRTTRIKLLGCRSGRDGLP